MEDRDPLVALQACIAAIRRAGMGDEGPELEGCLRRVGEALSGKDREIEWLREALEQSRESYVEISRNFGQPLGSMDVQLGGEVSGYGETVVGVVGGVASGPGVAQDSTPCEREWEGGNEGTTESESVSATVTASCEEGQHQWTTADAAGQCTIDANTQIHTQVTEEDKLNPEPNGIPGGEGIYTSTGVYTDTSGHLDSVDSVSRTTNNLSKREGGKQVSETVDVCGHEGGSGSHTTAVGEDAGGGGGGGEIVPADDVMGVATGTGVEGTEAGNDDVMGVATGAGVEGTEAGNDDVMGVATGTGVEGTEAGDDVMGVATGTGVERTEVEGTEGYQKVEFSTLFYHSATGYYYDANTQQFFAPVTTNNQATGQSQTQTADSASDGQATYESGPSGPTPKQPSTVADLLAAVSEHASQRCGLSYDETSGMYYDHGYAMYYDQERQLYYDPEGGTYYEYDTETGQYQVHSRVKLPKKTAQSEDGLEKVVDLCSSSDSEGEGSLEEGELRGPSYPETSPPPEEEWAPCLRMVVSSSDCVPRGTVFVVTQEGAQLGREPGGANPISVREVQVSKAHVDIRFSRTNGCFTLCDLASQNGTFLNNTRISEPKTQSKPHPLNHNDTLEIGTTSFTLHIHSGWDTCEFCRGGGGEGRGGEGKVSWKTELNRIKKRYGLRLKDTYGEDPVRAPGGYVDRAAGRRQTVGSDMPDVSYPDAAPASVHRAIAEDSVGHKMLQKLGWKKGEGLGKRSKGRTEPVTAEVRDVRSGLGRTAGGGKRSLDAAGGESAVKHARLVKHYSQVVARESDRSKRQ